MNSCSGGTEGERWRVESDVGVDIFKSLPLRYIRVSVKVWGYDLDIAGLIDRFARESGLKPLSNV